MNKSGMRNVGKDYGNKYFVCMPYMFRLASVYMLAWVTGRELEEMLMKTYRHRAERKF